MMKQLAPVDEREDEVKLLRRLEREFQRYDKRIVDLCQNGTFSERMVNLRTRDNMGFTDGLKSINSLSVALSS